MSARRRAPSPRAIQKLVTLLAKRTKELDTSLQEARSTQRQLLHMERLGTMGRPQPGRHRKAGQDEQRAERGRHGGGGAVPAPPEQAGQRHERRAHREAEAASFSGAQSSWNSRFQSSLSFHSGCCVLSSKNGPTIR